MRVFITLFRRELAAYFVSWLGWVLSAAVLLLIGLSFTVLLEALNQEAYEAPLSELFYNTQFFWLILLITSPIITMRSFALEKDSGTYETLMTTAVTDAQVLAAKYAGALAIYLLLWLPLLVYPSILQRFTGDVLPVQWPTQFATLAGILLLGCLYMALGCFASALTRSQMLAAMIAFLIGAGLFFCSFLSVVLDTTADWAKMLLAQISMVEHMRDFSRGILDTRYLVFNFSLTALFLYLTLKVMESRRWK